MGKPHFITLTSSTSGTKLRINAAHIVSYYPDLGCGAAVVLRDDNDFTVAETPEQIDALLGGPMSRQERELAEVLGRAIDVMKRCDPDLYPDRAQAPDDEEWDAAIADAEALLASHEAAQAVEVA